VFLLLVNVFFLSFFANALFLKEFSIGAVMMTILFASLMSGTDPTTVLTLLKNTKAEVTKLLDFEAIINTPITVIFPIIILFWFQGKLLAQDIVIFFVRGIMAGVGTGLIIGIISFRLMKRRYVETLSPLLIIALALVSYTIAEAIGGNGVLSVTALGIIFGISVIKQKESMEKFINIFAQFLTIVLFVLLGLFLKIPRDLPFLMKSLLLFGISLVLRYIAIGLAFWESKMMFRERMFLTLNVSKGVATATVAFILLSTVTDSAIKLSQSTIASLNTVLQLSFLFILYSLILASITVRFVQYFRLQEGPSILEKKRPEDKKLNNSQSSERA
ncbi:cation:proton antiporter, partial [Candidatus Woesearchaeota archaeon]|nr:cation:proton antiporter [Candidatus Woesearchaeota archaeon]